MGQLVIAVEIHYKILPALQNIIMMGFISSGEEVIIFDAAITMCLVPNHFGKKLF